MGEADGARLNEGMSRVERDYDQNAQYEWDRLDRQVSVLRWSEG